MRKPEALSQAVEKTIEVLGGIDIVVKNAVATERGDFLTLSEDEMGIRWFAGIQTLPNRNLFICNVGGKVPFLEISPDKRIVWRSPSAMNVPLGHGIQRLDVEGKPTK